MTEKPRLGVHDALYLKPLLEGLDSRFGLVSNLPAVTAVNFSERPEDFRGAFLSPIDYARHGGQYQIVPGIGVSSSAATNTIRLFVREGQSSISTVAVDVRVTSEIILAKIVLAERFPNLPSDPRKLQFVPMMPDPAAMLEKADAALVVNDAHPQWTASSSMFSLDLVQEWEEMTELPYVHGFWVCRDGHFLQDEARMLLDAKTRGLSSLSVIAARNAPRWGLPEADCLRYLNSFSYHLGPDEESALTEFFRYAFYHGVTGDIPEINYFPLDNPPPPAN